MEKSCYWAALGSSVNPVPQEASFSRYPENGLFPVFFYIIFQ